MAKPKFHWTDVALGAVVSILVLLVFWMQWAEGLEGKLFDMRAKLRARAKTAENVVLVGIDDDSIRQIGRWPLPVAIPFVRSRISAETGRNVAGHEFLFDAHG